MVNTVANEKFVLYPKTVKLVGLAFLALVFVVFGVFITVAGLSEDNSSVLMAGFGVFVVLFFGLCLIYFIYRIVFRKPSIIITSDSIMDNASYPGGGYLKWDDIQHIFMYNMSGQKFIGLKLNDTDSFIARHKGLKKAFMRMNKKLINTPVSIPQTGISMPIDQLYSFMIETWEKVKQRN